MKNLVLAVGVSVLALAGCDNNANAQAQQVSADVGSPQGNNTLIIDIDGAGGLNRLHRINHGIAFFNNQSVVSLR